VSKEKLTSSNTGFVDEKYENVKFSIFINDIISPPF
jgi:hypothetical protein